MPARRSNLPKIDRNSFYNDIGGWLAFFIFSLIFITPIFSLYILSKELPLTWSHIWGWLGGLSHISLFILCGILLLKKHPLAVKFTLVVLITNLVFQVVLAIQSKEYADGVNVLWYTFIWSTYLVNSKRVQSVFGHLKEKRTGYSFWAIAAAVYFLFAPAIFPSVLAIAGIADVYKNRGKKGLVLCISVLVLTLLFFLSNLVLSALHKYTEDPFFEDYPNAIRDTVSVGTERVYSINGNDYSVLILTVDTDNKRATFKINGEYVNRAEDGKSYTLADGTILKINGIAGDRVPPAVHIYLGQKDLE